jgi:hypothetical protein
MEARSGLAGTLNEERHRAEMLSMLILVIWGYR